MAHYRKIFDYYAGPSDLLTQEDLQQLLPLFGPVLDDQELNQILTKFMLQQSTRIKDAKAPASAAAALAKKHAQTKQWELNFEDFFEFMSCYCVVVIVIVLVCCCSWLLGWIWSKSV